MPLPVTKHPASGKSTPMEATSVKSKGGFVDRRPRPKLEDDQSGTLSVPLGAFPGGSAFGDLVFNVSGKSFYGRLKNFSGVAVTESQVTYDSTGATRGPGYESQHAFILDFGGLRSLLLLYMDASVGKVTLVLPWLGTGFADKSLYPAHKSGSDFVPSRDDTGATQVPFPSSDTQKLLVQVQAVSGSAFTAVQLQESLGLSTATFPSNVKASLEGRLPFWTHPGSLNGTVQVTGIGADLNALLAGQSGNVQPKLVLSTDSPGVLSADLNVSGLRPDLQASGQWGGQASVEVSLQGLQSTSLDLLFPAPSSAAWRVDSLAMTVKGKFPVWRSFPAQTTADPGLLGFAVSARFSVARTLAFNEAVEVYGFSLPTPAATATLIVEVYPDAHGQPTTGMPLASVPINLIAPAPDQAAGAVSSSASSPLNAGPAAWTDVLLPSVLNLKAGQYWLTAKAKTGACEWRGVPAAENDGRTLVSQEGGPWRAVPRLNPHASGESFTPLYPGAQALILRKPLPKENQPLLDIVWPAGAAQPAASTGVGPDAVPVALQLPGGVTQELTPVTQSVAIPIRLTVRASGTLTLTATAAYKEKTA